MALKIRLSRIGTTHQPHYRIVVAETRSRRDGAPVDTLGHFDPRAKTGGVEIDLSRVDYWLQKGAKPTDTLHAMIKRARLAVPKAADAQAVPAAAAVPVAAAEGAPAAVAEAVPEAAVAPVAATETATAADAPQAPASEAPVPPPPPETAV
jgi:small subunit ribosomal protein S16